MDPKHLVFRMEPVHFLQMPKLEYSFENLVKPINHNTEY